MINGSTPGGDVVGYALAEDGTGLGNHYSSSVGFAQHDMGFTSNWKHDSYQKHYPDGFVLEWIDYDELDAHEGFQKAFAINKAAAAAKV